MRSVLSDVASVYDPLGLYTSLSTKGKILLQDLHVKSSKFDNPLTTKNLERWTEITTSIVQAINLQSMSLPRSYFVSRSRIHGLHVFCDASKRAYGAIAYFVSGCDASFVLSK